MEICPLKVLVAAMRISAEGEKATHSITSPTSIAPTGPL